jgi:hypothetical protein
MIGESIVLSWAAIPSVGATLSRAALLAHVLFASVLLWSCLCRLVKTNSGTTLLIIRLAIASLGGSAAVSIVAPLFGFTPNWLTCTLLGSMAATQIATSHYWSDGVPHHYRKPQARLMRRRTDKRG